MLLHSKSQRCLRLSGWPPRFWLVLRFRRPARGWPNEDNETHTPNAMLWRTGECGGHGSPICVRGVTWRRNHGWRCSSAHFLITWRPRNMLVLPFNRIVNMIIHYHVMMDDALRLWMAGSKQTSAKLAHYQLCETICRENFRCNG